MADPVGVHPPEEQVEKVAAAMWGVNGAGWPERSDVGPATAAEMDRYRRHARAALDVVVPASQDAGLRVALRYIAQPTCGWPGATPIGEFIATEADEQQIRVALVTCITMAKLALDGRIAQDGSTLPALAPLSESETR